MRGAPGNTGHRLYPKLEVSSNFKLNPNLTVLVGVWWCKDRVYAKLTVFCSKPYLVSDYVHMLISIPPKYSVAQVMGYIKGKSAIAIARKYGGKGRNFVGGKFWAHGYFVSTVGRDETTIREYIRHQEKEDRRIDQLSLLDEW